jgi:hypothetical protein
MEGSIPIWTPEPELSPHAAPSCSGTYTLLSVTYLLLNISGAGPQGISPSTKESSLRGPPDHEDTTTNFRDWGIALVGWLVG